MLNVITLKRPSLTLLSGNFLSFPCHCTSLICFPVLTIWVMIQCVWSFFSCVWLFAIPQTVAHQAPLSMGFSRQEYWSGLPFPSPRNLPDPGIEHVSLKSLVLAGRFFATNTIWEARWYVEYLLIHFLPFLLYSKEARLVIPPGIARCSVPSKVPDTV